MGPLHLSLLWLTCLTIGFVYGVDVDEDFSDSNETVVEVHSRACGSMECPQRYVKACSSICPSSKCVMGESKFFEEGFEYCDCGSEGKPPKKVGKKYSCYKSRRTARDQVGQNRGDECARICGSLNKLPHFCRRHFQYAHVHLPRRVCACYGNQDANELMDFTDC